MDIKTLAEMGAVGLTLAGGTVTCLWAIGTVRDLKRIVIKDGGGLNVMTTETCDKCRSECRKGVDMAIQNQLIPILAGIEEMKGLFRQKEIADAGRHEREERRMQRLVSILGNSAVALSLLAERRKPDDMAPTLDAAIKGIRDDVQELAG